MAYLRKMTRSPYWYLIERQFDGTWKGKSTGLRADDPTETQQANRLAEKTTIREQSENTSLRGSNFRTWVPGYLASRYKLRSAATLRRAEIMWSTVQTFLASVDVHFPRQVKYPHAEQYLRWRINRVVHRKPAQHNTARHELKFLSLIMSEAVRREYAENNPFFQLVVPIAHQKRKKALSNDEIAKAREALKTEAKWMETVFETMLFTGCRFNESAIGMEKIDFERDNLILTDSKRDENDPRRYFSVPLHPELKQLFADIKATGAEKTVALSDEKNWRFNKFLRSATGATSHSIRVTFITRCQQAGLNERQTMRLVNHSSRAVHDVYSRLSSDDVRQVQTLIAIPPRLVAQGTP